MPLSDDPSAVRDLARSLADAHAREGMGVALPPVALIGGDGSIDVLDLGGEAGGAAAKPPTDGVPAASRPRYDRPYKETRQMRKRRTMNISGFVGPNGSGKSLCMVRDTLPSLDSGRRVLSTVMLLDSETGEPHRNYERLTEWSQLLGAHGADILMDEITGIAGSREAMGMPVQVQNLLNQLRRNDLCLRWSAPDWKRADTILRSVTQAIHVARGYWPDRRSLSGGERLWAPRRLFKVRSFSAIDFDEWSSAKASQDYKGKSVKPLRPEVVEWFRGPGSRAFASYDTLDSVSRVGEVLDSGRCAHCGGRRVVPQCKCEPVVDSVRPGFAPRGRRALALSERS